MTEQAGAESVDPSTVRASTMTAAALMVAVKVLFAALPKFAAREDRGLPDFGNAPRIFIANHTSHVDTLTLWACLPAYLRAQTRPVAALDYWGATHLRRHISLRGLRAVLIDRSGGTPKTRVLKPAQDALRAGSSLILFPEGTRGSSDIPGPFKAGLYHLAQQAPNVSIVPVYLDNTRRSLPKGSWLPVPLICTARFGKPFLLEPGEAKDDFLARARSTVMALNSRG